MEHLGRNEKSQIRDLHVFIDTCTFEQDKKDSKFSVSLEYGQYNSLKEARENGGNWKKMSLNKTD